MKRVFPVLALVALLFPLYLAAGPTRAGSSLSIIHRDTLPAIPQIDLELVLTDLDQPLYVTGAGDGSNRLFIVERPGRIKVLSPGANAPTVFLDITERVGAGGERGILGLAFHPQYSQNGRFFLAYSNITDGATVIAEYHVSQADLNVAESEEQQLLVIPQPTDIHHSGMLAFGADGFLYISVGDGGEFLDSINSAQSLDSLRGKILRIDIDHASGGNLYGSPESNPFFGSTMGRDEIYAYGFRNPWRFSIDRETGQLYAGDVGQDLREEVDIVTGGENYGWHIFEGSHCTGLDPDACDTLKTVPPLIEYEHSDGRCAVTGGYVYRGTAASLPVGAYVFADFCTGEIFLWNEGTLERLLDTDLFIASFGEDDNGEIYVVNIGGSVHRIVNPVTVAPSLDITAVQVRKRSGGKALQPVTVKENGKKYDVVVTGTGFAAGATVLANGRALKTSAGLTPDTELIAQLRGQMLARPGSLIIEVANPDGSRSNSFTLHIQ
jgi:glucose/arabinose dehydrogenase